jgi:hypothetical protein
MFLKGKFIYAQNMHLKNITYYSQTNIFMPNTQRDAHHVRPQNNLLGHILTWKHVGTQGQTVRKGWTTK